MPIGAAFGASAAVDTSTLATLGQFEVVRTETGSPTLQSSDRGGVVEVNSASAQTVTVPEDATDDMAVGSIIHVARLGAGSVQVVPENANISITSAGDNDFVGSQTGLAGLYKRAADDWVLFGDLAAS